MPSPYRDVVIKQQNIDFRQERTTTTAVLFSSWTTMCNYYRMKATLGLPQLLPSITVAQMQHRAYRWKVPTVIYRMNSVEKIRETLDAS